MDDYNYDGLNNHDELINEEKNSGTVESNDDTGSEKVDNSYNADALSVRKTLKILKTL